VTYRVILDDRAKRQLRRVPEKARRAIIAQLAKLSADPRPSGVKKLHGSLYAGWRIRIGKYRLLYTIDDARLEINVFKVSLRNHAYD